jgi:hypothetical protein
MKTSTRSAIAIGALALILLSPSTQSFAQVPPVENYLQCERNDPGWSYFWGMNCPDNCEQLKYTTGSDCKTASSGSCTETTFDVPYYYRTGTCIQEGGNWYCDVLGAPWNQGAQYPASSCENN